MCLKATISNCRGLKGAARAKEVLSTSTSHKRVCTLQGKSIAVFLRLGCSIINSPMVSGCGIKKTQAGSPDPKKHRWCRLKRGTPWGLLKSPGSRDSTGLHVGTDSRRVPTPIRPLVPDSPIKRWGPRLSFSAFG